MKKLLVMALALTMVVSLVACGGSTTTEETTEETAASTEAATEAETEAATGEVVKVPVTIVNSTGVEIYEMYLSGDQIEDWGDDVLGEQTMPDGTYTELVLNVDAANVLWDLQVADSEGATIEWYGIDISEMPADGFALQLNYDGTEATALIAESVDDFDL